MGLGAVPDLHLAVEQDPEVRVQARIPASGAGQLAVSHDLVFQSHLVISDKTRPPGWPDENRLGSPRTES